MRKWELDARGVGQWDRRERYRGSVRRKKGKMKILRKVQDDKTNRSVDGSE